MTMTPLSAKTFQHWWSPLPQWLDVSWFLKNWLVKDPKKSTISLLPMTTTPLTMQRPSGIDDDLLCQCDDSAKPHWWLGKATSVKNNLTIWSPMPRNGGRSLQSQLIKRKQNLVSENISKNQQSTSYRQRWQFGKATNSRGCVEKVIKGCKNKTETICIWATLHLIVMSQTKTKNATKIQKYNNN